MSTKTSKEIKLPSFSSTNPELWFETVDAILSFGDCDDHQKYKCIEKHLCNSDDKYLINNYLDESRREAYLGNMYVGFRKYVLEEKKEMQCFNLSSIETFTCRHFKPSAFLDHVCHVMSYMPKSMKRIVWLARLPRRIQKILMAVILKDPVPMEDRSLESLAALADGVAAYEKYHTWSLLPAEETRILPYYDESDPELWFYTLDEGFSSKNITDDVVKFESTKYALRFNNIFTASLFLTELPNQSASRYDNLRERIIKTFSIIKGDEIYRLVFRNIEGLKPSKFFNLLSDLAAKSEKVIPQLVVRTLWVMQLPVRTQSFLFKVINASREPLQDVEMDALCMLADSAVHSKQRLNRLLGHLVGPALDENVVDADVLGRELRMAKTLQDKIALGTKYCDFMYRVYYDHSPSESISSCTVFRKSEKLDADDYFKRGCTCWYHRTHGAAAFNCAQVEDDSDSEY